MPDPAGAGVQSGPVPVFSGPKDEQKSGDALCHRDSAAIQQVRRGARQCAKHQKTQLHFHVRRLLVCMKSYQAGQAKKNSKRMDDCHELDSLHQFLRLPVRRRLHLGQRGRRRGARPGRRLRPLHSCGRKAARIASPIFRAGSSSRPGNVPRFPARWAGMTHFRKPSRRTSEMR